MTVRGDSIDRDAEPDPERLNEPSSEEGLDPAFLAALEQPAFAQGFLAQIATAAVEGIAVEGFDITEILDINRRTTVCRAKETHGERREVVLKILRSAGHFPRGRRRLQREVRLLRDLAHPGIATFVAAGETRGGDPYCATLFVDGPPLHELQRARARNLRERVELIRDVADALAYMHQRGVFHRDLSPANVLVRTSVHPSRICVLDFELARLSDELAVAADETEDEFLARVSTDDAGPLTIEGAPFGTIGYMSPEQLAGHWSAVDARSDVFSVGVLLYELLADRLPWDVRDRSCAEASDIMRRGPATPIATLNREARGDLAVIVDKAIDRDPALRYTTMAALRDDLDRWLQSLPIVARRPSVLYTMHLAVRRRPRTALALGVAAVVSAASLTAYAVARQREVAALQRSSRGVVDAVLAAQSVIGSSTIRESLLSTAAEQTDQLLALAPHDPESLRLRAAILRARSVLAHERWAFEDARVLREEALAISAALVAGRDATDRDRRDLATSHILLGDLDREKGSFASAAEHYEFARKVHESLLVREPENPALLRQLACSFERRVSLADSGGRPDEAERVLAEGLAWIEGRISALPALVELRYERAALLRLAYRFAERAGDESACRELLRRTIDDAQALVAHTPTNLDFRALRANSEYLLARRAVAVDHVEEGVERYRNAVRDFEYLAAAEPSRVETLDSLRRACTDLASTEATMGRLDEANRMIRRAVALAETLERLRPDHRPIAEANARTREAAGHIERLTSALQDQGGATDQRDARDSEPRQ